MGLFKMMKNAYEPYDVVLKKTPEELQIWLEENFLSESIPTDVSSIDEMQEAGRLLGKFASEYVYLTALLISAKRGTRVSKRESQSAAPDEKESKKRESEDFIDKKDAISQAVDSVKFSYSAVSRMITVRQAVEDELRMTDGVESSGNGYPWTSKNHSSRKNGG